MTSVRISLARGASTKVSITRLKAGGMSLGEDRRQTAAEIQEPNTKRGAPHAFRQTPSGCHFHVRRVLFSPGKLHCNCNRRGSDKRKLPLSLACEVSVRIGSI